MTGLAIGQPFSLSEAGRQECLPACAANCAAGRPHPLNGFFMMTVGWKLRREGAAISAPGEANRGRSF